MAKDKFSRMPMLWLALLHYYTLFSGFIAYLYIAISKIKISEIDFIFIAGLSVLLLVQFTLKEGLPFILDLRFFWGWVIFYFIFKTNKVNQNILSTVLLVLSILTLVEAVLINSIIEAKILPNFPDFNKAASHFVSSVFYQRPYSFGGNATVGSSILVTLLAACNVRGLQFWIVVFAILSFISGTGTLMLFLVLIVKYRQLMLTILIPGSVVLITISIFFYDWLALVINRFSNKVGPQYIQYLFNEKINQAVSRYDDMELYMIIFGYPRNIHEGYGGDFGLLSFVTLNGLLGFLLISILALYHFNRANRLPLFVILLTSLHYPVIFYFPGQVVFGLLLSLNQGKLLCHFNKRNIKSIKSH